MRNVLDDPRTFTTGRAHYGLFDEHVHKAKHIKRVFYSSGSLQLSRLVFLFEFSDALPS